MTTDTSDAFKRNEHKIFAGLHVTPTSFKTGPWSQQERDYLAANHGKMSLKSISNALARTPAAVRGQITQRGLRKKTSWTPEEEAALVKLYANAGSDGVLHLTEFAASVGRMKSNVCTKAKKLGLVTNPSRKTVELRKDRPKYDTPEALSAARSATQKRWIKERGHPRGMAGKHHSDATRKRLSATSRAASLFTSDDTKRERVLKGMKTKVERYGSVAVNTQRGTWKAGWREIGGNRNYYRSRWEANYARYLEWLKVGGHIQDWEHEPETFWFEQIKRGTRSYLPDFRVWENDGSTALHEVKGWMDSRSRTTLARMKKYHPHERIVLIDGAQYRAIRLKVMRLIEGWEDSKRDTHA